MNGKLIFLLSMFGLAMAFAIVYVIPSSIEPFCWLAIFLVCAWLIAKHAPGKYFLHGFLTSLLNCVWITAVHIKLQDTYLANHASEAAQYAKINAQAGLSVNQAMLIMGPFVGIVSGLVLGLFAFLASKIMRKPAK